MFYARQLQQCLIAVETNHVAGRTNRFGDPGSDGAKSAANIQHRLTGSQ